MNSYENLNNEYNYAVLWGAGWVDGPGKDTQGPTPIPTEEPMQPVEGDDSDVGRHPTETMEEIRQNIIKRLDEKREKDLDDFLREYEREMVPSNSWRR